MQNSVSSLGSRLQKEGSPSVCQDDGRGEVISRKSDARALVEFADRRKGAVQPAARCSVLPFYYSSAIFSLQEKMGNAVSQRKINHLQSCL